MEDIFLERLKIRDQRDKRFLHLFQEVELNNTSKKSSTEGSISETTLKNMKKLLESRDREISGLKEIIELKGEHLDRINDELVSLDIENNLLQEKLDTLQNEYDALIERWLLKAQREADAMNSHLN